MKVCWADLMHQRKGLNTVAARWKMTTTSFNRLKLPLTFCVMSHWCREVKRVILKTMAANITRQNHD